MTEWSDHVHRFAKKHNMTYKKAQVSRECKEAYKKRKTSPRRKRMNNWSSEERDNGDVVDGYDHYVMLNFPVEVSKKRVLEIYKTENEALRKRKDLIREEKYRRAKITVEDGKEGTLGEGQEYYLVPPKDADNYEYELSEVGKYY